MAEAATRNGISGDSSKKAFFLAATAAGTLLSGWLFRQYVFLRQPASPPLIQRTKPEGVKSLAAPARVEPTPTHRLAGQRCAGCRRPAQGKESWYNLKGQLYCQTCAQGQAEKAGIQLVRPAAKPEKKFR